MRLFRLAQLLEHKYAAENDKKVATLEKDIRGDAAYNKEGALEHMLNIIKNNDAIVFVFNSKKDLPLSKTSKIALEGQNFVRDLVAGIFNLVKEKDTIELGKLRFVLDTMRRVIHENETKTFEGIPSGQFPHVTEFIFQTASSKTHKDRVSRDKSYGKFRAGMSTLFGFIDQVIKKIDEIRDIDPSKVEEYNPNPEVKMEPLPQRFDPQRTMISVYDIVDFIRQHGISYGIEGKEDWELAMRNDPMLKEEMTTVINALNRGHIPKDAASVKAEIKKVLDEHYARVALKNAPAFEQENVPGKVEQGVLFPHRDPEAELAEQLRQRSPEFEDKL